jgi:Flp pilus assembly protein TadD
VRVLPALKLQRRCQRSFAALRFAKKLFRDFGCLGEQWRIIEAENMTLNITVTTSRCIYQCADYRLTDLKAGTTSDFTTQKIVLVNAFKWNASVCFAGVGRTNDLNVGEWLAERMGVIDFGDPFDRLLDELRQADTWLSAVPPPLNRHSFSVGAFVGSKPLFALISNFEQPSGLIAATTSAKLSVYLERPTKPKTFVSSQKNHAVTRPERRRLAALAAGSGEPQSVYSALAEVNREVARRTNLVSPACFTTHVKLTGDGGGIPHDIGNRPYVPHLAIPPSMQEALTRLLDEQFGPGRARLKAVMTARADASDEYHETQLREKPNDPNAHSNYGAFLKDKKGDIAGAERQYRRALELDSNHVNALGNLGNLFWEKRDLHQAIDLYRRALASDPGNENVTSNYATLLIRDLDDRDAARDLLDQGLSAHPNSGRLLLLRAELTLRHSSALEALEGFRRARESGAEQAQVEAGYAIALQLTGAPIGECIAAYRTAIGLQPDNGALRLNLAQLLFIKSDHADAERELRGAMRLKLEESAQLEAQLYLFAHTSSDVSILFRTIKSILIRGGRLQWNVEPNIEIVSRRDPQKARLVKLVSDVMRGERDQAELDETLLQLEAHK